MTAPTRPVLRYHGGKWRLAPWIIGHFPAHRVYVEPFGGAASVLLRKERAYAEIYNDLDDEVVTLFRVLRDAAQAERLIGALAHTPFSRSEFEAAYEPCADPVEQSRRLVVRSYMGFSTNGHARKTGFNIKKNVAGTHPARDWSHLPEAMRAVVERFRAVGIESRDATEVMARHDDKTTLHYVDPPYLPETRDVGRDYRHELTVSDHVALLAVLRDLTGMVLLSGYPSALYDDALPAWTRVERPALADGARPRTEVLWLNPACADALEAERRHHAGGHGTPLFAEAPHG